MILKERLRHIVYDNRLAHLRDVFMTKKQKKYLRGIIYGIGIILSEYFKGFKY